VVDHHVDINLYINEAYTSFKYQEENLNNIQESKNDNIEGATNHSAQDRSSAVHSRLTSRRQSPLLSME
jgi:hypothetical protein